MASAALIPVAGKLLGGAAQSIGGGIGSGIGGIFGKKGKKIGRAIGGFGGKLLKGIFGFNEGGKVRRAPVRAFKAGGVVKKRRKK